MTIRTEVRTVHDGEAHELYLYLDDVNVTLHSDGEWGPSIEMHYDGDRPLALFTAPVIVPVAECLEACARALRAIAPADAPQQTLDDEAWLATESAG